MAARRPSPPAGGYRAIAVLRLSSLGDVVLALPVVRALRTAYPAAKLHFWVKEEYADLVRFDPAIDHVRVLEKDARALEDLVSMSAELEDCDLIVDLHGNLRTRILELRQRAPVVRAATERLRREVLVRARWLGMRGPRPALARYADALAPLGLAAPGPPRLHAGEAAERWARTEIEGWGPPRAPVALAPGAHHATKRWPEAKWCELYAALAAAGRPRAVFTTPAEREALPELRRRVATDPRARWYCEPLPRIAALFSHCAAAITHDSGLMHMAAARGLKVVALFGSTSPALGFAPSGEGHAVLCRDEPCQPCTLHGRERCPLGHHRCMREITVEQVLAAAQGLLPS